MPCKLFRRILAELCHHLLNLLCSVNSFECHCCESFFIFLIHINHCIPECFSLSFIVRSNLAKHHNRYTGIFIPCISSGKAAIALFQSKHIIMRSCLLEEFNLLSNIFESCQYFDQCSIIISCNCLCHICCYDCLNKCRILWHCSVLCTLS